MPTRWGAIAAYASVAAANQLLWLTFAPITTDAARHYGVSEGAIGWLSLVFPLIYVVLAIPAGIALDRWFRPSLLAGAWLTALGGVVRLGGDTFAFALAGQVLVAIAQPLILNAVTKVAAVSLPAEQRPLGISLGSAGIFAGTALALPLGPALGDAESLTPLLLVDAAVALAAALVLTGIFRPHVVAATPRADERGEMRTLWADHGLRRLVGIAALGFGLFVALTTWLQALLEPAGVSDTQAGWLLFAMVLAGVAGTALIPPVVARHGAERRFLKTAALIAAAGCTVLALAPSHAALVVVPLGMALLAALPVILELTERRAGDASGGATGLVWLAGNAGGIVAALLVQALVHHPGAAFALLAVLAVLVVPLVQEGRPQERTRPA